MRESRKVLASPVERTPPEGFRRMELVDPFEAHVGPIFERVESGGELVAAFYADKRHVRGTGTVDEGMMMTFADSILGASAMRAIRTEEKETVPIIVTMSMQTHHLGEARLGDLVLCRAKSEHRTASLLFNSGRFFVGESLVMTASCLWKILRGP